MFTFSTSQATIAPGLNASFHGTAGSELGCHSITMYGVYIGFSRSLTPNDYEVVRNPEVFRPLFNVLFLHFTAPFLIMSDRVVNGRPHFGDSYHNEWPIAIWISIAEKLGFCVHRSPAFTNTNHMSFDSSYSVCQVFTIFSPRAIERVTLTPAPLDEYIAKVREGDRAKTWAKASVDTNLLPRNFDTFMERFPKPQPIQEVKPNPFVRTGTSG